LILTAFQRQKMNKLALITYFLFLFLFFVFVCLFVCLFFVRFICFLIFLCPFTFALLVFREALIGLEKFPTKPLQEQ